MEAIKKILRTPSALVLVITALISLIGVIVQSMFSRANAQIPIDATSTAEAKLTLVALDQLTSLPGTLPPFSPRLIFRESCLQ